MASVLNRRRTGGFFVAATALAVVMGSATSTRGQSAYNLAAFTGGTNLWSTTTTWDPTGSPGNSDTIAISGTLAADQTINYASGTAATVGIESIGVTLSGTSYFVNLNAGVAGSELQFSTTSPSVSTNITNQSSRGQRLTVQNPLFQSGSTFTKGGTGNAALEFVTTTSRDSFVTNVATISGGGGTLLLTNTAGGTAALPTVNFNTTPTRLFLSGGTFSTANATNTGSQSVFMGSNGTLNVLAGGTVTTAKLAMASNNSNDFYLGGTSTFTVNGGSLTTQSLAIGENANTNGTYTFNQQAGTTTVSDAGYLGVSIGTFGNTSRTQTYALNVGGGTLQFTRPSGNADFSIGRIGRGSGTGIVTQTTTATISGTGLLDLGALTRIVIGEDNSGTVVADNNNASLTLSGGTLRTAREIARGTLNNGGGTDQARVFLNGGTLEATAAIADLFTGFNAVANDGVFVSAGSAVINTGGFAVGIAGNLLSNPSSTGGGLTKTGTGTLTLSGTGNTFTGNTVVGGGTLALGAAQTLNGLLVLGASAGAATAVTADLTAANGTFGGLTVQTLSADPNTITIGNGRTLATNGNVTIGSSAAEGSTTGLNVAGATAGVGTWSITNSQASGLFQVGANSNSTTNTVTVDLSTLGTFTANLSGGSSAFRVGSNSNNAGFGTATLTLADTSTITANRIGVGDISGHSVTHALRLGSGVQQLNTDSLVVANGGGTNFGRASGRIDFAGPTGSVRLRAQNGTDRANITMVTGNATSSSNPTATIDFRAHDADLLVGTMTMSTLTGNNSSYNSTFSFDQGTLDVTALTMGSKSSTSGGISSPTATVNLGTAANAASNASTIGSIAMADHAGPSGTINAILNIAGANTSVNVPGAWTVASNTATAETTGVSNGTVNISGGSVTAGSGIVLRNRSGFGTVNGSLSVTGGSLLSGGTITSSGSGGSGTSTLTLNGGSLNLGGFAIGGSGQSITANFQAGTLSNLGELNAGGTLTKSTSGTLTLTGINAYSGSTNVTGGRLVVNGSITGTGGVSLAATTILAGSGSLAGAVSGAGSIGPGNSAGILAAASLSPASGLGFDFEFNAANTNPTWSNSAASVNDVLRLTNTTTPFATPLSGGNVVNVFLGVSSLAAGDTFTGGWFTDAPGDFLLSIENASYAYYMRGDGQGSAITYDGLGYYTLGQFDPALSLDVSTLQITTANFADGTVANGYSTQFVVVPEPSTLLLGCLGLAAAAALLRRRSAAGA